jgi:hypothetical protein
LNPGNSFGLGFREIAADKNGIADVISDLWCQNDFVIDKTFASRRPGPGNSSASQAGT